MSLHSITIQPLQVCPTCSNYIGWDRSFVRRVDEGYLVPRKSRHYSASELKPFCIEDHNRKWNRRFPKDPLPETESPEGFYPTVIVMKELVGRLVRILPFSEEQSAEEHTRKRLEFDERIKRLKEAEK